MGRTAGKGVIVREQVLVQEWQPFFITLAGASAALAGLVFLAMSLHPQAILVNPLTRVRAYGAATGFLIGVIWSLIMLLPSRTAPLGSVLLIAVGIGGTIFVVYQQMQIRKSGVSVLRVVVADLLAPAPVASGLVGLTQPASELPFMLLAVSAGIGLFLLFAQSWTLALHSIIKPQQSHHSRIRRSEEPVLLQEAMTK